MNQMSNESTTSVASEVTAESIHKMLREHTPSWSCQINSDSGEHESL